MKAANRCPRRVVALGLLLLLLLSTACVGPPNSLPTPLPPATLAPAVDGRSTSRSGGKVTVYSALSESANKIIADAFQRAQPVISVEVLSLAAAGDLQTHIRLERDSPRADVLLGGSSEYHDPLAKEGLLEPYRSPRAAAVDPAMKDPEGFWTGWYVGIFGVVLNRDGWARGMAGRPKPATWDDLLDPSLRGMLVMPDPARTGGGYIFLANQVFRFGRDESRALDYMRRLHANVGEYTGTSPETIEAVGRGRYLMGLNWGHDVLAAAARGEPVEFVAPEDTAFEVGAVSIVRAGPNPTAARTFVDWVLSQESAELVVRPSNRLSVLKRVRPVPGAPTLESVRLVDYDRTWATENRNRLLARWQAAVGR